MTEAIENKSEEPLIGDVQIPNERQHLFATHQALTDFALVFNIRNYNVRYGQLTDGRYTYQLTYQSENN